MDNLSPLDMAIAEAQAWGKETVGLMKTQSRHLTGALDKSIRFVVRKNRHGELKAIAFKFAKHGMYVELGAGRGYRGDKGTRWFYKSDSRQPMEMYKGKSVDYERFTDKSAPHKMGSGKRPERPFFYPTLDGQLPKLADAIAESYGDAVINAIGFSAKVSRRK